eukprot:1903276-Rhodomonas_salina.1
MCAACDAIMLRIWYGISGSERVWCYQLQLRAGCGLRGTDVVIPVLLQGLCGTLDMVVLIRALCGTGSGIMRAVPGGASCEAKRNGRAGGRREGEGEGG